MVESRVEAVCASSNCRTILRKNIHPGGGKMKIKSIKANVHQIFVVGERFPESDGG